MTAPLRVGVVGAGAIVQVAHLGVLSRLAGIELSGICDIDMAKARSLAARFGIPEVYDDIEDLLAGAQPDAILVCTPNHLHEIHVLTALSAGVHVLCERPLALTAEGVARVQAGREGAGRVVMAGMNLRFRGDVQAVRQFLAGKELGPLRAIRGGWYIFRPVGLPSGWRQRQVESGGGAMLDLGLPMLDLALWLTDHPPIRSVTASFAVRSGAEVEDAGCALVRCDGELSIFVDVSWHHVGREEKFWFELMGVSGSARLPPLAVYKEMHGTPMDVTPTAAAGREDPFTASYRAEWEQFVAAVRGEVPAPTLDDQHALHRVMDVIRRSAAEGRAIEL